MLCMQNLTQIRGLSEAKVEKLVEAAKKMCPGLGWQSAMEFERQAPSATPPHVLLQSFMLHVHVAGIWT